MIPQLVTAKVIAAKLSVTPRNVCAMAQKGEIPCVRIGGKSVRFIESEVAEKLGFRPETKPVTK